MNPPIHRGIGREDHSFKEIVQWLPRRRRPRRRPPRRRPRRRSKLASFTHTGIVARAAVPVCYYGGRELAVVSNEKKREAYGLALSSNSQLTTSNCSCQLRSFYRRRLGFLWHRPPHICRKPRRRLSPAPARNDNPHRFLLKLCLHRDIHHMKSPPIGDGVLAPHVGAFI